MTFQLDVVKLSWSKSIFDAFNRLIKGVAGSSLGSGRRDLGLTINEMPFYGLYRLTTFQIDSNKAYGVIIDFTCIRKGVAESQVGHGPRVLGITLNELISTVYIRLTTFAINSSRASGVNIDL